jgi:cobalt-zinc-cadmium efflux system outer membrane protein
VTNRNQGNITAAKIGLAQARSQRKAALTELYAELGRAYADITSAYMATSDLQKMVLPGAQEAFTSAQTGYENGKFDYLTVLDSQRTLFSARMQYYDALVDYHRAKAQVEQLIGQSLESLGGQSHDYASMDDYGNDSYRIYNTRSIIASRTTLASAGNHHGNRSPCRS